MDESRIFNAEKGVRFERHEETGDVTIHFDAVAGAVGSSKVRLSSNTWISAIAEMTVHGAQTNHAKCHYMHTGIGAEV